MGPVPQPEEERDRPLHNEDTDIDDTEHPDQVINVEMTDSDSDIEDGEVGYMGYQALGQDFTGGQHSDDDSDEEEESDEDREVTGPHLDDVGGSADGLQAPEVTIPAMMYPDFPNSPNLPGYMQAPQLPRPEKKELLWNQPRSADIRFDTGQMDKIKSVMSGIQLPVTNIPDWAKVLSDDQWQAQVVNKLVNSDTTPATDIATGTNTAKLEDSDTSQMTLENSETSLKQEVLQTSDSKGESSQT